MNFFRMEHASHLQTLCLLLLWLKVQMQYFIIIQIVWFQFQFQNKKQDPIHQRLYYEFIAELRAVDL